MVVQHNLTAMNSNRMLGLTTASQAKSTEKLSSGYKINRAADDAAGLSISEKMRKQIRGLTQASANAQDGVSAVQTAEGALTEVHDMLQRMNELAVKASNGTNSEDDRSYIQNEIDQLVTEIDRVSTTTKFNETYLLKGTNADGTVAKLTFDTAKDNLGSKIGGSALAFNDDGIATFNAADVASAQVVSSTGTAASDTVNVTRDAGYKITVDGKEYHLYADATEDELKLDTANCSTNSTRAVYTDKNAFLADVKAAADKVGVGDVKEVAIEGKKVSVTAFADLNDDLSFDLHVGADSTLDNKIGVDVSMMSARGLGINGLNMKDATGAEATKAIDVIADAIQKVSTQRSALGAVQNRLEHTMNNLDNVVENTTSAESSIRDTDMATEMVKYSNNNILAQAGQAMLAQANQSNQGVLSLLG